MPFSVAAQRGIYMVVYGVTQKDIQFVVFDRANICLLYTSDAADD